MTQPPEDLSSFPPPQNPPQPNSPQQPFGYYPPGQPTSGYGAPGYPSQPPYAPPPRKPRPSAWWFLGPVLLLIIAGGIAAATTAAISDRLQDSTSFDSHVPSVIEIDQAGSYTIWVEDDPTAVTARDCQVTGPDGPIPTRPLDFGVESETDKNMIGAQTFDAPVGKVTIECGGGGRPYAGVVTKSIEGGEIVGVLAGFLVPLMLGGIALLWLLILGILFFTRPKRVRPGSAV